MSRNVISTGVIWIVEKSLCTLFNVTKQLLIRLSIERSFAGISTLIYNIVSSPFWFQSTPKGLVKSLISNSLARKQSSILVSAIIKIMTVPLIWSVSKSDLILTELILLGATISLFGFKLQNYCILSMSLEVLKFCNLDVHSPRLYACPHFFSRRACWFIVPHKYDRNNQNRFHQVKRNAEINF